MSEPDENALADRVKDLEGKLFQTRWTAAIGIVAAVAALVGHGLTYRNAARDIDLKLQELHSQNLEAMQGSYEQSKATQKRIATIYGIETAVKFELPFRKGSTIRALEELEATSTNGSEEDRKKITDTLSAVPLVLFVDSQLPGNIYCDDSEMISATNVDDIVELVKDFPVRIAGQIGDRVGIDQIADGVKRENPPLIVMHLGSFEGLGRETDVVKTTTFLRKIVKDGLDGSVIVYSRKKDGLQDVRNALLGSS